jgi:hypothetical protein
MNNAELSQRAARAAPAHRPSRLQLALLVILAPLQVREELIGDLVEELATSPRRTRIEPRAARAWLWRQIAASAPHLLRSRLFSGGPMAKARWFAAFVFLAVGSLQGWDSRVLAAPAAVVALVAIGMAAHALGLLLSSRAQAAFGSLMALVVTLVCAKLTSPTELPALGVIGVTGFIGCWMRIWLERRASLTQPPRAAGAA